MFDCVTPPSVFLQRAGDQGGSQAGCTHARNAASGGDAELR